MASPGVAGRAVSSGEKYTATLLTDIALTT